MTAPARITQAEINRAARAVKAGGFQNARIHMDLANQTIEIIITPPSPDDRNGEFTDDDI